MARDVMYMYIYIYIETRQRGRPLLTTRVTSVFTAGNFFESWRQVRVAATERSSIVVVPSIRIHTQRNNMHLLGCRGYRCDIPLRSQRRAMRWWYTYGTT